ncbi:hypothetical protein BDW59DRAFT_145357 [Aspergillus cavernicola]|uniref:Uncharacterized protein n=1 Tax=Aspergillus cavernicola TaxID=176166 RepID=A0ABR4IF02_9EURO
MFTPFLLWNAFLIILAQSSRWDGITMRPGECRPEGKIFKITSPDDVASLFADCTKIIGGIQIEAGYSGPLILPNITRIKGTIEVSHRRTNGITSIEAPELEELGDLIILNVDSMTRVSMPKLSSAYEVFWDHSANTTISVDLRSLRDAISVSFHGELSSVNLDSLVSANRLTIDGPGRDQKEGAGVSLDLSLPEFKWASSVSILGRISRISMPKLSSIVKQLSFGCASRFVDCPSKPEISLDLPQLTYVGEELSARGPLTGLSIPLLQDTQLLKIGSSAGLNVSLPLVQADQIRFDGCIDDINLPSLEKVRHISMKASHDSNLNCDVFLQKWTNFQPSPSRVECAKRPGIPEPLPDTELTRTFPGIGSLLLMSILILVIIRACRSRGSSLDKDEVEYEGEGEGGDISAFLNYTGREDDNEDAPKYPPPPPYSARQE